MEKADRVKGFAASKTEGIRNSLTLKKEILGLKMMSWKNFSDDKAARAIRWTEDKALRAKESIKNSKVFKSINKHLEGIAVFQKMQAWMGVFLGGMQSLLSVIVGLLSNIGKVLVAAELINIISGAIDKFFKGKKGSAGHALQAPLRAMDRLQKKIVRGVDRAIQPKRPNVQNQIAMVKAEAEAAKTRNWFNKFMLGSSEYHTKVAEQLEKQQADLEKQDNFFSSSKEETAIGKIEELTGASYKGKGFEKSVEENKSIDNLNDSINKLDSTVQKVKFNSVVSNSSHSVVAGGGGGGGSFGIPEEYLDFLSKE
jgi:putative cell wall-binding protein